MVDSITALNDNVGAGGAQTSAVGLADDFSTFLTLLTTQLQNQDPTEPLDTNEFTNQLVQFTSVEQQIRSNQNLENLGSLLSAQNFSASASLLGQNALTETNRVHSDGTGATWEYDLPATAERVTLSVRDADGNVVFEQAGDTAQGRHDFVWPGVNALGQSAGAGTFELEVNALTAENGSISAQIFSIGRVNSVRSGANGPQFEVGPNEVNQSDILRLIALGQ